MTLTYKDTAMFKNYVGVQDQVSIQITRGAPTVVASKSSQIETVNIIISEWSDGNYTVDINDATYTFTEQQLLDFCQVFKLPIF